MSGAFIQLQHVSKSEFRADIQGLRAIAVLGVILFHANREWLPGGFVGVDIFFVISGFLIGGNIIQKKSKERFSFIDFYLARARRIAPAYFVMLAAVTFCAAILFTPKDFSVYWQSAKSSMYFGSNVYFSNFGDYFAPSADELPLLHTWSLAIEMQFYLLLPAMLVLLPERMTKSVIVLLILALLLFGVFQVNDGSKKAAYFSLLVRMPEFLVGVFLALLARSRVWKDRLTSLGKRKDWLVMLGLLLILYSFVTIHEESNFPGVLIAIPCVGAALVIAGHGGRWTSVLASAPMVWVGGLSYSLYLWHWPTFAFVRYCIERYQIMQSMLAVLLVVVGLSYVSYRFVEGPFRGKGWFVGVHLRRSLLLLVAIAVPIIVSQRVNTAVELPLPVSHTRYADPSTICHGRIVRDCIRGSPLSNRSPVLVLGDSHAAQLNLFFDRLGEQTGKQFRVITASSCVTIPNFDVDRIADYSRSDCRSSIKFAQGFIPESSEIVVAAKWQSHLQSQEFVVSLKNFLSESQVAGKRVTLLWQVPMLTSDVQRLRRLEALGLRRGIKINDDWKAANQYLSEIAAEYPNVRFLEFSNDDLFLTPPFYRGNLIYHDGHHLNEVGAVEYANLAIDRF